MKPASALPPEEPSSPLLREASPPKVAEEEYRPFPMKETRNDRQENLEVPLVIATLGLPAGKRMLEIGCGCGIALPPFAQRCQPSRLVGLDIDPEFLSQAEHHVRERGIQAELLLGDARRMPFPDGAFDIIVDFGTLYHIARREQALAEVARVLSPGGLFVYETPLNQFISHPVRSWGRRIPWAAVPALAPHRHALLWASRQRRP